MSRWDAGFGAQTFRRKAVPPRLNAVLSLGGGNVATALRRRESALRSAHGASGVPLGCVCHRRRGWLLGELADLEGGCHDKVAMLFRLWGATKLGRERHAHAVLSFGNIAKACHASADFRPRP